MTTILMIVADPRDSGYGFVGPDGGEYGAPSLEEAIILAYDLYPDADIRVMPVGVIQREG